MSTKPPTIHEIIEAVAGHFRLSVADILCPRRDVELARPRQVVMWIGRKIARRESTVIGRALGRDHTTVLHGVRVVERLIAADREFAGHVWTCVEAVDSVERVDRRSALMRRVAA
jgi:chromosomal replication initiator protein